MYARHRASPDLDARRGAILVTWAGLQIASVFALIGYVVSGSAICMGSGLAALALMHRFSPNHVGRDTR